MWNKLLQLVGFHLTRDDIAERLEKELADALETVRSSVSMTKDVKDIEAQLEEKEVMKKVNILIESKPSRS